MIVSMLRLQVLAGREHEVIRFYEERGVFRLAAEVGGFRSGSLLRPVEENAPFYVLAEWDDADAYARWLSAPARSALSAELLPLLDGEPTGRIYTVVNKAEEEAR